MNQGCKGSQAISCLIQIKRKCPCCFHTKLTSSKRHFAAPDLSKARWLLQLIKGKLCLAEQHRGLAGWKCRSKGKQYRQHREREMGIHRRNPLEISQSQRAAPERGDWMERQRHAAGMKLFGLMTVVHHQ